MSDMYFKNLPDTTTPIIDVNLNKLNDVKVSTTQPITGEKVWIQKGKNLLDKKNKLSYGSISVDSTSEDLVYANVQAYTTDWIPCIPNTAYTVSGGNRNRWQFKNASNVITYIEQATITTPSDAKFMRCYCYYDANNTGLNNVNLQIEQRANATSYEAYIEPTLYVKNDNNVYEKQFIKNAFNTRQLVLLGDFFDTIDINIVQKVGNIVQVIFRGHTKTEIPNNTDIAKLPYVPISSTIVPISATSGRYVLGDLKFSFLLVSASTWRSTPIETNKWIQANFIYITND